MACRFEAVDRGHRINELELDSICTHIENAEACPLKGTSFHKKCRDALNAIRSARDIFRNDHKAKQWTLTTRGGTNRHGLWHCQVVRNWKCPHCHRKKTDCPTCFEPMKKISFLGNPAYECEPCQHIYDVEAL